MCDVYNSPHFPGDAYFVAIPFISRIPHEPLIKAWISKYMISKVWDKIIYPFPNFNGGTVKVWEWINDAIQQFKMDMLTYPHWD